MTVANIYRNVTQQPALVGVALDIGAEFIDDATKPAPRAVWVPTVDTFRPGKIKTSLDGSALNTLELRVFLTRNANVDIHLWAKANVAPALAVDEIAAVEELARRMLAAIRRTNPGNFAAGSLVWGATKGEAIAEFGRYAVLSVSFEVPIYESNAETAWQVTQATTESQTGTMTEPDGTGAAATGSPGP